MLNPHRGLAVAHYVRSGDTLHIQGSTDGELRPHPFQGSVPGHLPVDNDNPAPTEDDVSRPKVVVRQNKHRAVHSKLLALFLENFYSIVARFLQRAHPVAVRSGHGVGLEDLDFGANFCDASDDVLLLLFGQIPPRLVESLAGEIWLDQVGLAAVFSIEEDGGNVEAELLSFSSEKRQGFGFSSSTVVGDPDLDDERVAKAENG